MIPDNYTNITGGEVIIKKYCQVGSGCVILPKVTIGEGTTVGAMSLITKDLNDWSIYAGIPAKFFKARSKELLKFIDFKEKKIYNYFIMYPQLDSFNSHQITLRER